MGVKTRIRTCRDLSLECVVQSTILCNPAFLCMRTRIDDSLILGRGRGFQVQSTMFSMSQDQGLKEVKRSLNIVMEWHLREDESIHPEKEANIMQILLREVQLGQQANVLPPPPQPDYIISHNNSLAYGGYRKTAITSPTKP